MSRIANVLSWIAGAVVSVAGYWYVVVYVLDEFNHGYGKLTWFQLSLYLSLLSVAAGLVGYTVATIFLQPSGTALTGLLAGVAFTVCQLGLVLALDWAFADRDMTFQGIIGALPIGALSALVGRPKAS